MSPSGCSCSGVAHKQHKMQQHLSVCIFSLPKSHKGVFLFLARWWKVYDRDPYICVNLLQAMEEACLGIMVYAFQQWIRHARVFFSPRCLAKAHIACDVDEKLWPDQHQRQDAEAA